MRALVAARLSAIALTQIAFGLPSTTKRHRHRVNRGLGHCGWHYIGRLGPDQLTRLLTITQGDRWQSSFSASLRRIERPIHDR
jgi:hypothetical protein